MQQETDAPALPSQTRTEPRPLTADPSPRPFADPDTRLHLQGFEHGTDAELIERRVRTAAPLASPSPGPGAGSALRRDVLYSLRTGGPASPDQLAQDVGASRTGVLQQLRTLETAGLVSRRLTRHGVGRPRHVYDLTPAAQELFPANYGALAQSFLAAIRQIGGDALIHSVFEARRELLKARIGRRLQEKLPAGATLWERVREMATYQDETGYLGRATCDPDGTIHLSEHNCAISGVSGSYPIACDEELALLSEVLGARVTRECHMPSGGRSCTYRVEAMDAQPAEEP
jgi:predicted ArsR family transcriptional regulator